MTMKAEQLQQEQSDNRRLSKKELYKKVYITLAASLTEFNLSGKRYEKNLKKTSKLFAKEISKSRKKNDKK